MRTIIALATLGLAATTTIAQSQDAPGLGSPARPKVDKVDVVAIKGAGYALPIYIQEGKDTKDKDAHFFYVPLFYIATEGHGKLKHHIDDSHVLTLKVSLASNLDAIEDAVRDNLIKLAKETNRTFKLDEESLPYRIDSLQLSRLLFQSEKKRRLNGDAVRERLISEPVRISAVEFGEINVYFYLDSREEAESFVSDLENDIDQLTLSYRFDGVSDEVCKVEYDEQSIQNIAVFKEVAGKGGEGLVARHQAASIADELVQWGSIDARCSDLETAENLTDRLMERLSDSRKEEIAGWDKLEKTIAFDANSFKADVVESVETQEKSVHRDQLMDAFAKAEAETETEAKARSVSGGWGGFSAKVESSLAKSESESNSEARKLYKDVLEKKGVYGNWEGQKFVPKSIDVYSEADLNSAWGKAFAIEFGLTEGVYGGGNIRLTKSSWKNSISIHDGFPVGGITMYFGDAKDLPRNWKIADGQHVNDPDSPFHGKNLPDLRGRFIAGASNSQTVGHIGGSRHYTHQHSIDLDTWWAENFYCISHVDHNGCDWEFHAGSFQGNSDTIHHFTPHAKTGKNPSYAIVKRLRSKNIRPTNTSTNPDTLPPYMLLYYIIRIK